MIPLEELVDPQAEQFYLQKHPDRSDPTFIPIHLTGGIGDIIISLDAIKALAAQYDVIVYTHHIEAFKYFYPSSIPVFKKLPEYTWKLEFNTVGKFHLTDSFHGFLIKDHERLFQKQQLLFTEQPRMKSIIFEYITKFFLIAKFAGEMGCSRRTFPLWSMGIPITPSMEIVPRRTFKKIITIHDGFDIHNAHIVSGRATKTWKWEHWNALVGLLHTKYPDYKIIQLGTSTARPIDGVDEQLVNQTSIAECFDILSQGALHIDGDSGLVHAATRLQTPCVVMWGPTPHEFYGYKENINLHSGFCSQACYGVKDNWNDKCVIGYPSPMCMDEISPDSVMKAVGELL